MDPLYLKNARLRREARLRPELTPVAAAAIEQRYFCLYREEFPHQVVGVFREELEELREGFDGEEV